MADAAVPGVYGKLPALGDFVTRRLPRAFVEPWDGWLQSSLSASRAQLGEGWLDTYLTSPLWRFALSPEICGPDAWAGVLTPSVDRVGRYFPLTVVVSVGPAGNPFALAASETWFGAVERLLLTVLESDDGSVDAFDAEVQTLGMTGWPARERSRAGWKVAPLVGGAWRIGLGSVPGVEDTFALLLDHLIGQSHPRYSLWYTAGSQRVQPSLLICRGLPPPDGFAAMLDGQWQGRSWGDWPLTTGKGELSGG